MKKKHTRTMSVRNPASSDKLTWLAFAGGLLLATWGLSTLSAMAADETIVKTQAEFVTPEPDKASPWALLGGLDLGYAHLSVGRATDEVDKSGFQVALKVMASYYFESPWVLDGRVGWAYTSVSGQDSIVTEKNILRSGFVEVAPRYRLGPSWQLGPVLNLGFGADLTLGQPFTDRKLVGFYPGVELLYETANPKQITRVGGRISTSLSIPDRSLVVAQLVLHFGGPIGGKTGSEKTDTITKVASVETTTVVTEDKVDLSQVPAAEEAVKVTVIDKSTISVELSKEETHFQTGSAKLSPRSKEFLRRMGAYLNDNQRLWTRTDVGGHTDIRGRLAYNMMLSKRRASSVSAALVSGGASARKITMAGYGPKIPIDARYTPSAWAKNRRVEIRISGSTEAQALADGITKIKMQTIREYRTAPVSEPVKRKSNLRVRNSGSGRVGALGAPTSDNSMRTLRR